MTIYDAALSVVTANLDDERRDEVRTTAQAAAAETGRLGRVLDLVGLAGLALRVRARRSSHLVGRGAALGVVAAALSTVLPFALAATIPLVLLALGWFDPRYAVAATTVWGWRLVAAGLGELPEATVVLFLRLLVMAVGVLCATAVAQASLRRVAPR